MQICYQRKKTPKYITEDIETSSVESDKENSAKKNFD